MKHNTKELIAYIFYIINETLYLTSVVANIGILFGILPILAYLHLSKYYVVNSTIVFILIGIVIIINITQILILSKISKLFTKKKGF